VIAVQTSISESLLASRNGMSVKSDFDLRFQYQGAKIQNNYEIRMLNSKKNTNNNEGGMANDE
jgi:hypothetical protein